jgi:hypothetical protein
MNLGRGILLYLHHCYRSNHRQFVFHFYSFGKFWSLSYHHHWFFGKFSILNYHHHWFWFFGKVSSLNSHHWFWFYGKIRLNKEATG